MELRTLLWKTPARRSHRLSLAGRDNAETTRRHWLFSILTHFLKERTAQNLLFNFSHLNCQLLVFALMPQSICDILVMITVQNLMSHVVTYSSHLKFVTKLLV